MTSSTLLITALPTHHSQSPKENPLTATKKPSGKVVRVYGSILVQRGTPIFLGGMPSEVVVRQKKVALFDSETNEGYQREPSQTRINEAGKYYEAGGRMPNPLLMNIRESDFDRVTVKPSQDIEGYEKAQAEAGNWIGYGYIEFPDDLDLWLYDGQHRGGGLNWVLDRAADFGHFPVPVSVTLGLTEDGELKEFYNVNNFAKGVRTDLAWTLLRRQAQVDPDLADLLEDKGQEWVLRGLDVVEHLKAQSPIWKDSIQLPNQKKVKSDKLTIMQAQFVRSLRPVFEVNLLKRATPQEVGTILDAFWEGVRRVLPEAFDDPKHYVLQKGPGVIALHRVLPEIIEVLRGKGDRAGDPDAYERVLQGLTNLSGEITTDEGTVRVHGVDYWKSGPEGVASQFTGDAGRKRLYVNIRSVLPKPTEGLSI